MVETSVSAEEDTFDHECFSDALLNKKEETIKLVCAK